MKKICKLFTMLFLICLMTACKQDNFEGIDIYTTVYPMEYITEYLYGEHSNINSIYPSGVDVFTYELNEQQIKDYSSTTLYIFNGTNSEKDYVAKFFKYNKKLKIIDATSSMEAINGQEELWLDPSNFLMMAQNIRYGLKEYIDNHYFKNSIDEKYSKLKEQISLLDATIYDIAENADNKVILANSKLFKYLEKYGLEVIVVNSDEEITERELNNVKKLIGDGVIQYIFMKSGDEPDELIKNLIDSTGISAVYFHTLSNISGEERNAKKDYMSIMNDNINLLRNELYD